MLKGLFDCLDSMLSITLFKFVIKINNLQYWIFIHKLLIKKLLKKTTENKPQIYLFFGVPSVMKWGQEEFY